jgi:pimeloyl-ACP methyl ester carboxylesterase
MARDAVVLVHGLWMRGREFALLRRRLAREYGFDPSVFSYPTLRGDTDSVVESLADFAQAVAGGRRVHFVGHSLGGLIVLRMLARQAALFAGNAVLLASPVAGSRAAAGVLRWPAAASLLGPHLTAHLRGGEPLRWQGAGALGVVAGTRRIGLGQFFARFDEPNDGTVAVSETVIPGLADRLVVPRSHMGLLWAREVAGQVGHFLRHARFAHGPSHADGALP